MIAASDFIQKAKAHGFTYYSGVPCSYLQPLINFTIDSPDIIYVGAANEGDAVAIVSGAQVAGKRGVVMFQNSGFGNAVNPLTSLNAIFKIPILVITTWRGEPGGDADEPQHKLMGKITPGLFDLMGIPWDFFPNEPHLIEPLLSKAVKSMDENGLPFGLIMKKNSVSPYSLSQTTQSGLSRDEVLERLQNSAKKQDVIVATTGYTGRALYALGNLENQFYMVGSMGCASSFGLGIALAHPDRRVFVVDGDGAALMRLGALATIGHEQPKNLIHILLDNGVHESTGGQATSTSSADLGSIAAACGYTVQRISTIDEFTSAIEASNHLTFLHVKTSLSETNHLPRPAETPHALANTFKKFIQAL